MQLMVFCLDGRQYALPLAAAERVLRAVELTPLPGAPPSVAGAIDVEGQVLPVFCMRRRFLLPHRDIDPADQLLIARTSRRTVALLIDEAESVIECEPFSVIDPESVVPGLERFRGLVQLDGGLVLIHDLEKFLSPDEARALDAAMGGAEC